MKFRLFLLLSLIAYVGFSQKKYPQNYFRNPLDIPIILSGSFGELRSNHFHSGLDIKTQQREGLPIYAAADGYISRIKVQQYGFGKALYITHPNGYTTVYGHLKKFSKEIQEYVKSIQYRKESYSTGNIFPDPEQFPVKKGDIIALSGDTGGSGGPHLHYEIRDTKTEHVINPMFFGLKPKDNKAPTFTKLMIYPLDNDSRVNRSTKKTVIPIKKGKNNIYTTNRISAAGSIGFSAHVFDRLNDAWNKNGIYSLELKVNGKRHFYHDVETFSFSESKYINLHIDYPHYGEFRKRYQKTFKVDANKLSTYEDLINNGKLKIEKGFNYKVEIIAKDFKGNTSVIKIPVIGKESNAVFRQKKDTTQYKIVKEKFNKFSQKGITIAFPKNTFYENFFLDFKVDSSKVKIHTPTIPLDKRYTLTFDTSHLSEVEKKSMYIANINNKKYPRYVNTKKKKNKFYTSTKSLGYYTLLSDVEKPTITPINFKDKQWLSKLQFLKVKIRDKKSGIKSYKAYIDGDWILMEFNHKKGILSYDFSDKPLVGSKHTFEIIVSDNVGNTNTLSSTFYRKD